MASAVDRAAPDAASFTPTSGSFAASADGAGLSMSSETRGVRGFWSTSVRSGAALWA